MQAGLAGGSADAAGVIAALDYLLDTRLPTETLGEIGAAVGADAVLPAGRCGRGGGNRCGA